MSDVSPAGRGSRRRPGGMQQQGSHSPRTAVGAQGDIRWSTRARCYAVRRELAGAGIDRDSTVVQLQGAAEDIEAT